MSFLGRKPLVLFWLSRTNLKFTMISIAGLIIALSMLFGALYNINFARQELYLDLLEVDGIDKIDFEVGHFRSNYEDTVDFVQFIESYLEHQIVQYSLSEFLSMSPFFPSSFLDHTIIFQNQSYFRGISGHTGLNESILDDCVPSSRLPSNQSEILVYAPENTSLIVNDVINITIRYYPFTGGDRKSYNMTFTITGILKNSTVKEDSFIRNYLSTSLFHGMYDFDEYFFLNTLDNFYSLIQQIKQDLTADQPLISITSFFLLDLDVNSIDQTNAVDVINSLNDFVWDLNEQGNRGIVNLYACYNNPIYDFNMLLYDINHFFISFTIISSPVLILVIVLVFFSLGLVDERRKKLAALMMARGVSNRFIFFVLSVETTIIALVATAISAVTGMLLSVIIGSSSGFLTFNRESAYLLVVNLSTLQLMFLLGFGVTLLVHIPSIVQLSRSTVKTLEQETSKKTQRKAGILRSQFDVLLLFMGLSGIVTLDFFMRLLSGSSSADMLFQLFSLFILVLLLFSPLFILIGSIMSYNRFIAPLLHYLSRFFWSKNSRLLSVAVRNLNMNVKTTAKATLLVAITISFLLFIAIVPISFMNHHEDAYYYDNGSDIWINLYDEYTISEETETALINDLAGISGLKTTVVQQAYHSSYSDLTGQQFRAIFLGISPDFRACSHWKDQYDDQSLEKLVSTLYSTTENNTVIMDSRTAREEDVTLQGDYSLVLSDINTLTVIPIAYTDYFPRLITRWSSNTQFFVCKKSFIIELPGEDFSHSQSIWGKIDPESDALEVTRQVKRSLEDLGLNPNSLLTSVPEILAEEKDSLQTALIWLIVNYNFLTALITAVTAVTLFFLARTIQNAREIALGRALGLKKHQLFLLVFTEPLLVFLLSGIPGTIIGILLLTGLVNLYGRGTYLIPPIVIDYNLSVILGIYGSLIVVMGFLGVITSTKAINASLAETLEVE